MIKEFAEIFKALSDETRVRILYLLNLSEESICVCEIVDSLEEPQYNISRHVKILRNAGLIEEDKEGRWRYYSLTKKRDLFIAHLFQTISSIPKKILIKDSVRLKERLKIRKEGKCVLGIQNPDLLSRKR
ncbi:MAG: ArsR/SmtB family transcription factor [bacterium]